MTIVRAAAGIGFGLSAALVLALPAFAQGSPKAVFEKLNLLGTFAWDCSKPVGPSNYYYVHRPLDAERVQRDMMTDATARSWAVVIEKVTESSPGQITISGVREGQRIESVYQVEPKRVRVLEGTAGTTKEISGGRFTQSGRETPWMNKCEGR